MKGTSITKDKISGPVELISSTSMLSYTSPTLRGRESVSTLSSSASSPTESNASSSPRSERFPSAFFNEQPVSPRMRSNNFTPPPPPTPPPVSTLPPLPIPASPLRTSRSQNFSRRDPSRRQGSARRSNSSHPFGAELAKVSELAEDYGVSNLDAVEEEWLSARGLRKYGVEEYLAEIALLDPDMGLGGGWI